MLTKKRITLKHIAELTGVSYPTVSRVLNNKGKYYSNKTRDTILKAAKELNYIPNAIARSLKEKKTKMIAYLIPDDIHFYFSIYRGINKIADKKGYSTSAMISYFDKKKEHQNIERLLSIGADGVIIASQLLNENHIDLLREHSLPIVLVDWERRFKYISNVTIDNEKAAFMATNYLIEKGYENILYISGPPTSLNYKRRYLGFKRALKNNGIKLDKSKIIRFNNFEWLKGDYDKQYEFLENIIKNNKDIDALFLDHDVLPILAQKILYNLDLKVPEDVAILGFQEIPIITFMYKPITSIVAPTEEMGATSMTIILKMLENNKYFKYLELEPKLNIRNST